MASQTTQTPTRLIDQPIPPLPIKMRPNSSFLAKLNIPLDSEYIRLNRRYEPELPTSEPSMLFTPRWNNCSLRGIRFVANSDPKAMLVFVDGAVSSAASNDTESLGGFACVYAPKSWTAPICVGMPIDGNTHTVARAELLASLDALNVRRWNGEGFEKVILATSSLSLVDGITKEIYKWKESSDWKTPASGNRHKNRDLWEELLEKVEECGNRGLLVQFWYIPKKWNEAKEFAKAAAAYVSNPRRISLTRRLILTPLFVKPVDSEYRPKKGDVRPTVIERSCSEVSLIRFFVL